jgi:phospholipid-binding lipoprotein MlaA
MNDMRPTARKGSLLYVSSLMFLIFVLSLWVSCLPARAEEVRAGEPAVKAAGEGSKPEIQPAEPKTTTDSAVPKPADEYGDVTEKDVSAAPSDEYGNVTEGEAGASGEGAEIADPIEPWNRAMYHFNDKLYFWALKPVAEGYKAALPEDVRGLVNNFYYNLKAPIRIFNNLLQGRPGYAGIEFARLLINSTIGVGGLRDCAKECFGITGRDADFGQTLGKYGVGHGFYIVWPFIGPSSARDAVGFAANWYMVPTAYVIWPPSAEDYPINPLSVILYAHYMVNDTTFHLGEYETLKSAAIDPYVAMRDIYAQYRKKKVDD